MYVLVVLSCSDEIQSVVRAPKAGSARHAPLKKNPLKNLGAMLKLNPYAKVSTEGEWRICAQPLVFRPYLLSFQAHTGHTLALPCTASLDATRMLGSP